MKFILLVMLCLVAVGLNAQSFDLPPVAVTNDTIDWGKGDRFYDTLSASITYAFKNTSRRAIVEIYITNTQVYSVTWPTSISWRGGFAAQSTGATDKWIFTNVGGVIRGQKDENFIDVPSSVVDTTTPDAPTVLLETSSHTNATIEIINPIGPPGVRSNIIKVSPNTPIGETTVIGDSSNYPTMTVQDLYVPVFTSAVSTMDVTLSTAVDQTKSFVTLPTFQASLDQPKSIYIKAYLSADGTKVTLTKGSTANSSTITNIRFSVVTANKWMTVQHLPFTATSGTSTTDVTMTTVDTTKSFPLLSMLHGDVAASNSNFPTVHFTTLTNARVTFGGSLGSTISGVVQVVTIDSASVQAHALNLGVGDTTASVTLSPAVTLDRSFSVMTYRQNAVAVTDIGKSLLMGNIDSTTGYSVRRDHAATNPSIIVRAFIVTFNSGWPIVTQRTLIPFAAAATSATTAISEANTSRTFVWSTGHYGKSGITTATTDTAVSAMFSIYQSDSVTLTTSRNTGDITRLRLETITFPEGGGASTDTVAFDSLEVATGTFDTVARAGDRLFFRFDVQPSTPYYVRAKAIGINDSVSDLSVQLAFTTPATPSVANTGDWFVDFDAGDDADAGTVGAPFATLLKALSVALPGDTIRVNDTCEVQTTFTRDNGSNPVVIKSYTGAQAVINISGSVADGFFFSSSSGGYVVDSIRFIGGNAHIRGERSNNVRVKNCYFYNGLGWSQIYLRGTSGWIIQNNTFDKNDRGRYNNVDETGMGDCIFLTSYRDVTPNVKATRNLIEYNTVTNGGHAGILLSNGADGNRVRNNTIYWCKSLVGNINGASDNIFENNVAYWPATFGMMAGHTGGGIQMLGDRSIWRGNTVYRDTTVSTVPVAGTSWLNSWDTRLHASISTVVYTNRNNRIYNNTFVNDVVGSSPLNTVIRTNKWTETGTIQDMQFRNNLLIGEDSIVYLHDNKYETAASQTINFAYNMFGRFPDDAGKKIIRILSSAGTTSYTLTEAKASISNIIASSNLEDDPEFMDAANNDFTLGSSSPANSAGGALTTADGAGTNSTTLIVNDSYWFSDGQGIVDGDLIFMQGWTSPARIVLKNDKTLSLSAPKTWSNGASIYFGSSATPNIGAD